MYSYAEQLLIVDLSAGQAEAVDLDDALAEDVIGGTALAARLLEQHADGDPVVIATGPLTGTLVPGAALAVMSRRGADGSVVHVPLSQYLGAELKYSGFDAVVIKGEAASPSLVWIHDGLADLEDATELWGKDTWETADLVKEAKGDQVVQLLSIGPAGEAALEGSGLVGTYWSTNDHAGFAAAFGRKKLKALAFRGLGVIDVEEPEEMQERSLELTDAAVAAGPPRSIAELAEREGVASGLEGWLSDALHRNRACFACPAACLSYVKFAESPQEMRSTEVAEPGYLLSDAAAAGSLQSAGFVAADAGRILGLAAKLGISPRAAAAVAAAAGSTEAALAALSDAVGNGDLPAAAPVHSALSGPAAAACVVGVCPLLVETTGRPEVQGLLDALALATGLELEPAELDELAAEAGSVAERPV